MKNKKQEKMLTIIIPVYNVEKYLDRCLESLYSQNFDNFEVILVDDGSSDSSGEICDKWKNEKENISVFHNKNSGVSFSRNFGIKKAKTKYVTFIDSDDYVSSNYFATLSNILENFDVDMYVFNLYKEDKGIFKTRSLPLKSGVYSTPDTLLYYSFNFWSFINAVYTKIYSLEILKNNNIYFKEDLKICEDITFSLDYIEKIENFYICDAPLYYYALNKQSVTQKRKLEYFNNDDYLYNRWLEIIQSKDIKNISIDELNKIFLTRAFFNINNLREQKIPTKIIRNALNTTKMCKPLLDYKYNSTMIKVKAKQLKYYSKNHMILFYFAKIKERIFKFLKKLKNK